LGIASESWSFGDGATASGCCPTHQYAADGDYTVELTVVAVDGRSASTSQVVHVQTTPPPPNDDIADAISLQPLPFSVDLNTRFATADPSDPVSPCQGHSLGATAWFRYDAATSAPILLGGQADFNAFAEVYSGSPGSLTWVNCFYVSSAGQRIEPTAGTTYYIVVAPSLGMTGGLLTFSADWAFTLGLAVNDSAKLNAKTGAVTISGTITCNKPASLQDFSGTLTQRGRNTIRGTFTLDDGPCDGVTRWQARVTGDSGSFAAGRARLEVSANASTFGGESDHADFSVLMGNTPAN
jgi:PKD repeat protein